MKIQEFNERLKNAILIADGAMGSLLHETVGPQRCFDELNTNEPEAVFRVHQAYIEAGAQIIETNTFGANRFKLAPLGLGDEVQKLNSRGVKIAREARDSARREVLVAGSMGPLGLGVQSRHPEPGEIQEIFYEQALALEERGVDLYILETFSYIEELLLAIGAIRSFSGLPIIAQLTYSEEGTTFETLRPIGRAEQLRNKNVQVVGTNCTLGRKRSCRSWRAGGAEGARVSGMPNAGLPKREGDRIVYPKVHRNICTVRPLGRSAGRASILGVAAERRPRTFAHGERWGRCVRRRQRWRTSMQCPKEAGGGGARTGSKFRRKLQKVQEFMVCDGD